MGSKSGYGYPVGKNQPCYLVITYFCKTLVELKSSEKKVPRKLRREIHHLYFYSPFRLAKILLDS